MKRVLEFGIRLNLQSKEEQDFYMQCLVEYVVETLDHDAFIKNKNEIEIFTFGEKSLLLKIKNDTMTIEPQCELAFDAVMVVLKFIADKHQQVLDHFRGLSIKESSTVPSSEEESSEDDSEWI
tara:strand:- start:5856 stop:6224 length:369 start_codon:yes stop_codon:yes gene_type:complete